VISTLSGRRAKPPFCMAVGSMAITALLIQIWAFCAPANRQDMEAWATRSTTPIRIPDSRRLDRHGAPRIVRRVARRAGITKIVGPHTLRHAFITAALDAGVPLRDVQEAASDADPRTTIRYDRGRASLDRHATYIVAAFVAGAAR
jgi:integrase